MHYLHKDYSLAKTAGTQIMSTDNEDLMDTKKEITSTVFTVKKLYNGTQPVKAMSVLQPPDIERTAPPSGLELPVSATSDSFVTRKYSVESSPKYPSNVPDSREISKLV